MFTTILLTLFLGIVLGLLLALSTLLHFLKVKCPKCKQLRPLKEIIFFCWKTRTILGNPCPRCQRPKPQIEIM